MNKHYLIHLQNGFILPAFPLLQALITSVREKKFFLSDSRAQVAPLTEVVFWVK